MNTQVAVHREVSVLGQKKVLCSMYLYSKNTETLKVATECSSHKS